MQINRIKFKYEGGFIAKVTYLYTATKNVNQV